MSYLLNCQFVANGRISECRALDVHIDRISVDAALSLCSVKERKKVVF